jgi:hypothetical protein
MIPGGSYPSSKAAKLYRKIRKTLHIDSRDRRPGTAPGDYTVTLPRIYENVYSVTLKTAEIPVSWYVFSTALNNVSFNLVTNIGSFTVTLDPGNYTIAEFIIALNDAFSAVITAGSAITVSQDTSTGILIFLGSGAITSFTFAFSTPTPSVFTWWGLGYFMGFYQINYVSSANVIRGSFIPQPNPYNYILMELEFINKQDETAVDNRLSGRVEQCFAKIPTPGPTSDIIFFREYNAVPLNKSVMSPPLAQLKSLHIKFRDHNGRVLDFNNIDHSFTLEFELLDNNFDEYSSLDFTPM